MSSKIHSFKLGRFECLVHTHGSTRHFQAGQETKDDSRERATPTFDLDKVAFQ